MVIGSGELDWLVEQQLDDEVNSGLVGDMFATAPYKIQSCVFNVWKSNVCYVLQAFRVMASL